MASDPMTAEVRHRTEAKLWRDVEEAKAEYESAKAWARALLDPYRGVKRRNPNGTETAKKISTIENAAMRNYTSAVYRLSRYVLDAKKSRKL